jgi:hypothetical protein
VIDLTDVTFLIPVRIESRERLENLDLVLSYLLKKFDTTILLVEDDKEQKVFFSRKPDNVKYEFRKNDDPLFHKTKLLNDTCRKAKTPRIVIYDCDVLFPGKNIVHCVEALRHNICDFCFPYSGMFYDVPRLFMPRIMSESSVDWIDLNACVLLNHEAIGGAVFFNRNSFIKGGMANENFVSWGPEDSEIVLRFTTLGFSLSRTDGVLYHMSHRRGINSCDINPFFNRNRAEFDKIASMKKHELEAYMKSWNWLDRNSGEIAKNEIRT